MNRVAALALAGAMAMTMTACKDTAQPAPEPSASGDTKSIFRPEFQVEPIGGDTLLAPLDTRIGFPEGSELDEAAKAELASLIDTPQVKAGGAIVLRGHSDAGGSDEANLRASRARAEAVRDFLVANGVAEDRITIIAFGEQNPVAPNALPDGSPNEEGRAKNRRVDVHVAASDPTAEGKHPTLAETLSDSAQGSEASATTPSE